jgi:hypothetical protein
MVYGDVDLNKEINVIDVTLIQKHIASIAPLSGDSLAVADTNGDKRVSIQDATLVQKWLIKMTETGLVNKPYASGDTPSTEPATDAPAVTSTAPATDPPVEAPTAAPTDAPTETPTEAPTETPTETPTDPPAGDTMKVYLKTKLTWITTYGCDPYVFDTATGESYMMVQDVEAYPNVYVADVPESVTDAVIYRAKAPQTDMDDAENVYNKIPVTFSKSDNCYTLDAYPDGGSPEGTLGAYVAETPPSDDDMVSTISVQNDAGWTKVYLYGWGAGIPNTTIEADSVNGDVFTFALPEKVAIGTEFFLFKDTEGDVWTNTKQTKNLSATKDTISLNSVVK